MVREPAALPDGDIRAMAVYLASFNDKTEHSGNPAQEASASRLEKLYKRQVGRFPHRPLARALSEGACAVCHKVGGAPLFGTGRPWR